DVLEIEGDPLAEVERAAAAHLPETSHPRKYTEAAHECRLGEADDVAHGKRTRPHERHVAEEHVEELRELVDGGGAEEAADAREPRILLHLEHGPRRLVQML